MEAVAKLIKVLEKEGVLVKEIIAVAGKEIEALASGDSDGLLRAVSLQERLTAALVGLENERCAAQRAVEKELNLPQNGKLSELPRFLPAEPGGILAGLRKRLAEDVAVLLRLQFRLSFLLRRALVVEEAVARILCRAGQGEGFAEAGLRPGLVDRSV
uniref:FlgN protein n=1 Tax=Ammonifex degensii TaxID=42838 RepID=A0A7C2I3B8_9THEO